MNLKTIQLVFDNNGDIIDRSYSPIRSHSNYKHVLQVVSPNSITEAVDATISTFEKAILSKTVRLRLAMDVDGNYIKGSDVVDPLKAYYQTVADYNVWEVELGPVAALVQKINVNKIGLSITFSEYVVDSRALTYLGTFGDTDLTRNRYRRRLSAM